MNHRLGPYRLRAIGRDRRHRHAELGRNTRSGVHENQIPVVIQVVGAGILDVWIVRPIESLVMQCSLSPRYPNEALRRLSEVRAPHEETLTGFMDSSCGLVVRRYRCPVRSSFRRRCTREPAKSIQFIDTAGVPDVWCCQRHARAARAAAKIVGSEPVYHAMDWLRLAGLSAGSSDRSPSTSHAFCDLRRMSMRRAGGTFSRCFPHSRTTKG